jgi:hypothetical protein
MSRNSRDRLEKKGRRARHARRERHVRSGWAHTTNSSTLGSFDMDTALGQLAESLQDERVMRRIALNTGQRRFERPADMVAGLAKLGFTLDDDAEEIARALTQNHPLEDAQDIAFVALSLRDSYVASVLVQFALGIDPHCVDAAALAALFETDEDESTIARLELVVTQAEIALGGRLFLADCGPNFWDDVLARPYMRARSTLADVLLVAGRRKEAEAHFTELLALDRGDPLQIGETVLGFALERRDMQRARELAAFCEHSDSPVAPWARALERWCNDDIEGAARLVRRGRAENPLAERAVLAAHLPPRREPGSPPDMEGEPSPGRSQAVFIGVRIGSAWRTHPDACAWLVDGAHATSAEQRRSACASFTSPVSTLLSIGDDGLREDWVDYAAKFGLSSKDVAELLRMASDPAMNDLEEADPRSHAPSHAWRALATLGATEAIEPLLEFHVVRLGHDQVFAELHALVARIGAAALQPLVGFLKDVTRALLLRGLACESLAHLAGEDPLRGRLARMAMAAELELCDGNEPELNAWLVLGLVQLRGTDHAPVIRRAFARERVKLSIAGDWVSVAAELGIDP